MHESGPYELLLQGRIQIGTARDALTASGVNPAAEKLLTTSLDTHTQLSKYEDQNDLTVYIQGGETERIRTDVVTSLQALEQGPDVRPDVLEAARGLLALLREE